VDGFGVLVGPSWGGPGTVLEGSKVAALCGVPEMHALNSSMEKIKSAMSLAGLCWISGVHLLSTEFQMFWF
jgi:hypothetical protein